MTSTSIYLGDDVTDPGGPCGYGRLEAPPICRFDDARSLVRRVHWWWERHRRTRAGIVHEGRRYRVAAQELGSALRTVRGDLLFLLLGHQRRSRFLHQSAIHGRGDGVVDGRPEAREAGEVHLVRRRQRLRSELVGCPERENAVRRT